MREFPFSNQSKAIVAVVDTHKRPMERQLNGKQRDTHHVSPIRHNDQAHRVEAVAMAAPIAPCFGMSHRLSPMFINAAPAEFPRVKRL